LFILLRAREGKRREWWERRGREPKDKTFKCFTIEKTQAPIAMFAVW
jgi:hypothetical protein